MHSSKTVCADILDTQMNNFRNASAGVVEQLKQESIPAPCLSGSIWGVQNGLNFCFG
jgi:hypothetical protein